MAAKLIKKFKVRDEDLWDDDKDYDAKPGTWSRRVAITIGQSDDCAMITTRITMFRHPAVRMFLWQSKITPEVGAMEFVADSDIVTDASEFWISLHRELDETWRVTQKLRRAFPDASCGVPGAGFPTDEFSWLAGVSDGFETEEHLQGHKTREHREFIKLADRQAVKLLAAPKRRRPRFNPLAVACIPKPAPAKNDQEEKEFTALLAKYQRLSLNNKVMEAIKDAYNKNNPADEVKLIDPASYDSGFRYGVTLAKRWKRKAEKK